MSPLVHPAGRRTLLGASFLAVACLLGYGYYLQYVEYLDPCPLCITQRLFYYAIGIVSLVGLLAARSVAWQRTVGALFSLAALGGVATAGRQVWLQHLPPERVPECGLGLQYQLDNESLMTVVAFLFKGDGNCAEVVWTFLGLSIGEWSLAWFVGFLTLGVALALGAGRLARRADAAADGPATTTPRDRSTGGARA